MDTDVVNHAVAESHGDINNQS